jgi:2'-5' RNA ligase
MRLSMRLFVAIELTDEVRRKLRSTLDPLRSRGLQLRWVRPENWHLTLKFIGEWPDERLDEVTRALGGIDPPQAMTLGVRGLGVLPNLKSPRVFWAGVEHGEDLTVLAGRIEQALEPLGVKRDGRPFRPHVTLARFKRKPPRGELQKAIDEFGRDFGAILAERFVLFESRLGSAGSVYRKIAEFPLRRAGENDADQTSDESQA